jgi:RNA polymerase sigma factor (sigma-70 family)
MAEDTSVLLNDPDPESRTGSVTRLVRDLGQGTCTDERLFDEVLEQLAARAGRVLRGFPRLRGRIEEADLVNEFVRRLMVDLSPADIRDRGHFFALAAQHFRWILLDILRSHRNRREGELPAEEIVEHAAGPGTRAAIVSLNEQILEYLNTQVPDPERQIFELRVLYELTYKEISELLDIPLSTVAHKYTSTRDMLCELFGGATGREG